VSSPGDAGTAMRSGMNPGAARSEAQTATSPATAGDRTTAHYGQYGQQPQPAQQRAPQRQAARAGGRRVRLTVSHVDPWSAMKISFLLSIALGIAGVVMVAVLWSILAGMGAFDQVNSMISSIIGDSDNPFDLMDFMGFGRVVSLSVVIAVIDVVLITALSTLAAFLYNVCASLVGGIQMTLTDD
jgi:hypothetical protein